MKRNAKGMTWKEHSKSFLRDALKKASATWKPKSMRTDMKKVAALRKKRLELNREIKAELQK